MHGHAADALGIAALGGSLQAGLARVNGQGCSPVEDPGTAPGKQGAPDPGLGVAWWGQLLPKNFVAAKVEGRA